MVVRELRLPRVLTAAMVGACLAVSGAIFQGLVRNPLVSPDIIGVNAGAVVVAVFWIVSGLSYRLMPLAAFLGASVAAAVGLSPHLEKGHLAQPADPGRNRSRRVSLCAQPVSAGQVPAGESAAGHRLVDRLDLRQQLVRCQGTRGNAPGLHAGRRRPGLAAARHAARRRCRARTRAAARTNPARADRGRPVPLPE